MDYKLAGSRFTEIKYGLVADLLAKNPYTAQCYVSLEFKRGVEIVSDIYQVHLFAGLTLEYLGKTLKHKEQVDRKISYTFTDGSIMTVGT